MRPLTYAVSFAVFASLLAAGCGRPVERTGPSGTRPESVVPYPIIEEPPTLDPARVQDVYVNELLQNIFEGLVMFDGQNHAAPWAAERWDISPDGKVYTFHLRPNVRFHNGRLLTAADF